MLVPFQMTISSKGVAANGAFIWSLPSVPPPMYFKVGALSESLVTDFAFVRTLSKMNSKMLLQITLSNTCISTFAANKRFFSAVDTSMCFQV